MLRRLKLKFVFIFWENYVVFLKTFNFLNITNIRQK